MIGNGTAIKAATATGAAALIFGSTTALVFAGFSGALVALALAGPRGVIRATGWVAMGTVSSAFLTPLAIHYLGTSDVASRGVAFLVGFSIMHFLPAALNVIKAIPERMIDKFFGGGK